MWLIHPYLKNIRHFRGPFWGYLPLMWITHFSCFSNIFLISATLSEGNFDRECSPCGCLDAWAVLGHSGGIKRWEGGAGSNKVTRDLVGVTVRDRCRPSSRKRQEANTYWIGLWRDLPGSPVVRTPPSNAGSASWSLVRELRSHMPHSQIIQTKNRSNTVTFNKDFKSGPHQKKKTLKNKFMELETTPILRITCSGKVFCSFCSINIWAKGVFPKG